MRPMNNFFSRLILAILLVFGIGLSQASLAVAVDNDDSTVKICQLTVGATSVGTNEGAKADIHYTRKEGNKYYYKVLACGLDPVVNNCSPNQKVVLAYQYNWSPWFYMDLSKKGSCYEGELELSNVNSMPAQFDVEIDSSSGACASKLPLCRRAYGTIKNTSASDLAACTAAENAMKTCSAVNFQTKELIINQETSFSVTIDPILGQDSCDLNSGHTIVRIKDPNGDNVLTEAYRANQYGTKSLSFTPEMVASCDGGGGYELSVTSYLGSGTSVVTECTLDFGVGADSGTACEAPEPAVNRAEKFQICDQIKKDTKQHENCVRCMSGDINSSGDVAEAPEFPQGVWTAVGCIKTDPQSIIITFVKIGLGIAGGGALLMILSASFIISTSAGDAKKFGEAKEMIGNAVIGLIFIIMSITILQFIGVSLFRIPGFGE